VGEEKKRQHRRHPWAEGEVKKKKQIVVGKRTQKARQGKKLPNYKNRIGGKVNSGETENPRAAPGNKK